MGLTGGIADILASAASASLPQQSGVSQNSTTFGPAPLVVPPVQPRFQPPAIQMPKAGNEFQTVSGNKRATKQAMFSGIAQMIKAGGDYIQARKNRQLEADITRLINAQEGEKEAQAKLQQNPQDTEAQKALVTNRAIRNDITTDPKKSKQLQKAYNIDLFGNDKNKNEKAAFVSAMVKWQQDKAAADKAGQVEPLSPIAQRFERSQPIRQQLDPQLALQAQMIEKGLTPGANEVLKAQATQANEILKASVSTANSIRTATSATDRDKALEDAAKQRADSEKYHADKLYDAQMKRDLGAQTIADINSRARKYVADSTAKEWDKRIEILKAKEGTNPIFKALSKDADTYTTELKNLITDTNKLQAELDKKGSSLWGIKFSAASGLDATIMRNNIDRNNLRMVYITKQLENVRQKLRNLNEMGLIAPDTSNNTPNDANEPGSITVTEKDMNDAGDDK